MEYPQAQYQGDSGEASATYRPADHDPEVVFPNGMRCHFLAIGRLTRGLFGLYRMEMGPEPAGPSPHFHRSFTESFYVLAGTVRVYDGRAWIDAHSGDFVHVPEGGVHGFRNESGAPASMLIHFAPGAPREAYFEESARFDREGRLNDEEMAAFYREHDNHFVPQA